MTDQRGRCGFREGEGYGFTRTAHDGERSEVGKPGIKRGEATAWRTAVRDVSLYLDPMLVHAGVKFEGSDAMCVSGPVLCGCVREKVCGWVSE